MRDLLVSWIFSRKSPLHLCTRSFSCNETGRLQWQKAGCSVWSEKRSSQGAVYGLRTRTCKSQMLPSQRVAKSHFNGLQASGFHVAVRIPLKILWKHHMRPLVDYIVKKKRFFNFNPLLLDLLHFWADTARFRQIQTLSAGVRQPDPISRGRSALIRHGGKNICSLQCAMIVGWV